MYDRAQLANERFQDLLRLAANQTTQSPERQRQNFERQKARTDSELRELRDSMLGRSHPMDNSVRDATHAVIDSIDRGMIEAENVFRNRINHPGRPHKTLCATATHTEQLLRQLENLVFFKSKNLDRRKSDG